IEPLLAALAQFDLATQSLKEVNAHLQAQVNEVNGDPILDEHISLAPIPVKVAHRQQLARWRDPKKLSLMDRKRHVPNPKRGVTPFCKIVICRHADAA